MSRAFIKEDAGDSDELPERPQSGSPNYVTPAGLGALRRKAAELKAASAGLARETPEARGLLRDLKYHEGRVASAILVDAAGRAPEEVRFGATVETLDAAGATRRFTIVGQDEADEAAGLLSWDSSLALAMMGAKVGDTVEALRVTAIRYPPKAS